MVLLFVYRLFTKGKASINVRRARYALIMSLSCSERLVVALAST